MTTSLASAKARRCATRWSFLDKTRSWSFRRRTSMNGSCPRRTISSRSDALDRKSTRLNSSHLGISYADFSLKKKNGEKKWSPQTLPDHEQLARPGGAQRKRAASTVPAAPLFALLQLKLNEVTGEIVVAWLST